MNSTARSSTGSKKGPSRSTSRWFTTRRGSFEADADVTKLAYHFEARLDRRGAERLRCRGSAMFSAGMQSDSDHLLERYAGYNLGVSRRFGERVRLRFDFESFHQQWNATTLRALEERPDVPGSIASDITCRSDRIDRARGAADAHGRRRYSAFSNSVSGRQVRGIKRRDDYSAISQALGFGCFQAGGRRRIWAAGGHQITRQ